MNKLGQYLKTVRLQRRMSLRGVEAATGKAISNAYLSQLERGLVKKPSPLILYDLSMALAVPYEGLMERAGYIRMVPIGRTPAHRGRVIDDLSEEEEVALLEYLEFIRWRRNRQQRLGEKPGTRRTA